ncbi:CMP-N-acetylneuraminate-beta-galactosamide-alpha-2,3-sialyltransferase 2-like [Pholidichthys leucotaenia]
MHVKYVTQGAFVCLLLYLFGLAVYSRPWILSNYSICHKEPKRCGCDNCITDGDPWFREYLEEAPKPFMSIIHKISEEDFTYWKGLQHESRNFTFYNRTVDRLFQMFPPMPDYVEPNPKHCRTCAVVGNSVNLKGSNYGSLIDNHDVIIRMNRGRTKGFEKDVGSKTTHHVIYPESAMRLENTTHTRLVFFPFKIQDLLWLISSFNSMKNSAVNSNRIANKNLVMILNPAFIKYVHEVWLSKSGRYPSTGFMTLIISMLMCDKVDVFGFGADSDGNWSHYFENAKYSKLKTGPHPGSAEYKIIQKLHKRKIIFFFRGW